MESKAEDGKPVFSECELLLVRFEWGGGGSCWRGMGNGYLCHSLPDTWK
jgi:hypothetical protein